MKIRSDIPNQSPVVATVKHGDRLELLQRRRRFFRVRTPSGAEGWTDERQLLAKEDMDKLRDLASRAKKMGPQGQATTFGELNVHTQPSRSSPSFFQFKETDKVDVLTHVASPRTDTARKPLLPPPPKKQTKTAEKKSKEPKYPPLQPLPKPPGPPSDWLDLSKTDLSPDEPAPDEEEAKDEKPTPMDDWSLIRTKTGEAGWVLTRRLVMAIPDEVAQYAEGHRIVSYFKLGEVHDGDQVKPNWLWTTIGDGIFPYDFDSFRVFIWSLRRHRYETAYIERNLRGYAPVMLKSLELPGQKTTSTETYPGFSICAEKKDGVRRRRDYVFLSPIVRYAGDQDCAASQPETVAASAPLPSGSETKDSPSLIERLRQRWRALTQRRSGS